MLELQKSAEIIWKQKKTKIYYHDTEMSWHLHKTNGTFFEGLYFSDPEQRLGSSVVSND